MVAPTGLFSGLTPEMAAAQEEEKRRKTNLELAQSANPLAGSLYSSYNMADQMQGQIRDIFGNTPEDSPQVRQAKEEQTTQQEIAALMAEANSQGLSKADTAKKIKEYLLSKNKVDKAMQYEQMNLNADKTQSEINKNTAATETSQQEALLKRAELLQPATRLEALKRNFPKVDPKILEGAAQDAKSFVEFMTGKTVETQEGVYNLRPVGEKERIGSSVDRSVKVINTPEKGNAAFVQKVGESLPAIETSINNNNQFISSLQQAKDKAIATAVNKDRYTGAAGEAQRFVASTLSSFGLLPPDQVEKLVKSDAFESEAANLLLTKTGGKIGAGFSNTDLAAVKAAVGNSLQNPRALIQIISELEKTTLETNKYLKGQYERGRLSIQQGAPLPLDASFDSPKRKANPKEFFIGQGSPDYEAYKNNIKGYRDFLDKQMEAQGKIVVTE